MLNLLTNLRRLNLVFLVTMLAGCAGTGNAPVTLVSEPDSPYAARQDAVGTLLNNAWQAIDKGQLEEASGWLSRAMRIDPTEPATYFYMARIRKQQGELEQARQLAGRALSLGPGQALERQLEALLDSLT